MRRAWVATLVAVSLLTPSGCARSRTEHRVDADTEAYQTIAERNCDPRWQTRDVSIELDSRSRYFDPCDPDHPPMPVDDPASHRYMHCVDGKEGWRRWHDDGDRTGWENPAWQAALASYVEFDDDGAVTLNVDSALRLAYMNSPVHQTQLETLYLSSLDVTEQRFRLNTQFFGGYDVRSSHRGDLIPPAIAFNPGLGRYVVNPAFRGVESNRLTVGRPSSANPAIQARRRLATAGEVLAGFANSFVVEFTGSDVSLASSLANFAFVQPLLRGAGRDIALEQLTQAERTLLANLRAYSQFRQGFFTQVVIGELGVNGPRRFGTGTVLQSFSGTGFVGGYLGLLQQIQRIRNTRDNLNLQLRTLEQLEFRLEFGSIDLVQVDQFRQSVERERTNLLRTQNTYELQLENYKTQVLGLPPDLPIAPDDTLLEQFQFVAPEANALLEEIVALQTRIGRLPADAQGDLAEEVSVEEVRELLEAVTTLAKPVRNQLDAVPRDLETLDRVAAQREKGMSDEQADSFLDERRRLAEKLDDLQNQYLLIPADLERLDEELSAKTRDDVVDEMIDRLRELRRIAERSVLVQAGARVESVIVPEVELDQREAFRFALGARLDFMNGRAAVVDSWRAVQVASDALQAVLNVTADADIRTARNHPFSFRAPTGSARLGVEFDAPFTRLVERNTYRESLITYQRNRRNFIQSMDNLNKGLRALLRQVELLRRDLEIQRRAVTIAIRQVDVTQAALDAPNRPAQPGQRPNQFGPTAAINLLTAASSLRDTQNALLAVWLDYYATRLRLARELGAMRLDPEGRWLDPLSEASGEGAATTDADSASASSEPSDSEPPETDDSPRSDASGQPSDSQEPEEETPSDPGEVEQSLPPPVPIELLRSLTTAAAATPPGRPDLDR